MAISATSTRSHLKSMTGLLSVLGLALLGGCATMPARGPDAGPIVLERDFKGRTYAKGVFVNSITGSTRAFDVVLDGRWDGKIMTLKERFAYQDGEKDVKTWTFTRTGPGRYVGKREDVVGTANVFTDNGAVRLSYDVVIGGTQVHFEDVIERRADGVIVNRAIVSKFGVPVGTVDLSFARRQADLR